MIMIKKIQHNFKLDERISAELTNASLRTGISKTRIVENGLRKELKITSALNKKSPRTTER